MPVSDTMEKAMLDWVTGGAAVTRPSAWFLSLATQSPTSQSAFDGPFILAGGAGFGRATISFAAANSPQMSATNLNAFSQLTATAVATAVGWNLYGSSSGANRLAYGTATAAIGCASGDNVAIGAGALKIALS